MKVWLVEHIYYDDCYVDSVFLTKEKAEITREKLNNKNPTRAYYEVTEMEVTE